jgi:hypothetical protein
MGPCISNIFHYTYIQQDATLHSLFILETALHVSGGTSTHHQERIQLYLQRLVLVTPLLLPAAIAAGNSHFYCNVIFILTLFILQNEFYVGVKHGQLTRRIRLEIIFGQKFIKKISRPKMLICISYYH